jgi:hypothetical protein
MTPHDFASDTRLPPALAARMQAVANRRADAGLMSCDGKLHRNAAARAMYDAGCSTKSPEYIAAAFGEAVLA